MVLGVSPAHLPVSPKNLLDRMSRSLHREPVEAHVDLLALFVEVLKVTEQTFGGCSQQRTFHEDAVPILQLLHGKRPEPGEGR